MTKFKTLRSVLQCYASPWTSIHACAHVESNTHLGAAHADDAVDAAAGIVEERHGDGMFASWQPVAFGGRVDLEDMSSGAEDGLLPLKHTTEKQNFNWRGSLTGQLFCCLHRHRVM